MLQFLESNNAKFCSPGVAVLIDDSSLKFKLATENYSC